MGLVAVVAVVTNKLRRAGHHSPSRPRSVVSCEDPHLFLSVGGSTMVHLLVAIAVEPCGDGRHRGKHDVNFDLEL